MTQRTVVKRLLIRIPGALPVMVDRLECGHLIVDPGKCSSTRLCVGCAYEKCAPNRVRHLVMLGHSKRTLCGSKTGPASSEGEWRTTCLRCIAKMLALPWMRRYTENRARGPRT